MKEQRKGAQEPRIIRNKDLILLSRVLCIMQTYAAWKNGWHGNTTACLA